MEKTLDLAIVEFVRAIARQAAQRDHAEMKTTQIAQSPQMDRTRLKIVWLRSDGRRVHRQQSEASKEFMQRLSDAAKLIKQGQIDEFTETEFGYDKMFGTSSKGGRRQTPKP